jgi:hypothetical protein
MSTNSKSFQVSQAIANGPDMLVCTHHLSGFATDAAITTTGLLLLAAKANTHYLIVAAALTNEHSTNITYTIKNTTETTPVAGTDLFIPRIHLDKGTIFNLQFNPDGWYSTGINKPLRLQCDANAVGGYNFVIREVYVPTKHPDLL